MRDAELLAALANGIIPADVIDSGAAAVNAGPRLAQQMQTGPHAALYRQGLDAAEAIVEALGPVDIARVLGLLRERAPAFFAQFRMDVSALYLSDPEVWRRIGFPGPSTRSGGYPDFDQPQTEKVVQLKES